MNMNSRRLFFSCIAVLLQLPIFVYAAGLVPCGGNDEAACQTCHLSQGVNEITAWLVGVLSIVVAIMFMIAGFRLLTANGNPGALEEAKGMIINV